MSFRRKKPDHQRAQRRAEWIERHREALRAIGVPPAVRHVLLASGLFRLAYDVSESIARRVKHDARFIDEALAFVLDPTSRELTWGELVREHGFPDEDLEARRCDEIIG